MGKFWKSLGDLALATEFSVKSLLNSLTLQSGVKLRPKSRIFTYINSSVASVTVRRTKELGAFYQAQSAIKNKNKFTKYYSIEINNIQGEREVHRK